MLAILFLFNLLVPPILMQPQIDTVDYGTFMDMIEDKDIGQVEITDTEITFTNKDNTQLYQTGVMYDPTLPSGSTMRTPSLPPTSAATVPRCSGSF